MTCESCGQPFACELSLGACWCSEITLADATRSMLRSRFSECLCRECLTNYQAKDEADRKANGDSGANVTPAIQIPR